MMAFKKSKIAILLVLSFLVMGMAVGCGGTEEKKDDAAQESSTTETKAEALSGTVKLAGSTSVQPLAEELADKFMEANPDVSVSVQGGGSGAGIESASKGTAQIGTSSREIKEEEKSLGLTETVIAKDGIAVIVHPTNGLAELDMDKVKKIFSGEVKDWSQIGGKKGPITVVIREEGSGTRDAFQELALGKETKFVANAVVQNSTGAVKTAVAKDPNAIGFISLGSLDSEVKALKVDGVEPSEATVLDGSYKISRPFLFLTKGEQDAATKAFIDYVLGDEGQTVVAEDYVRIK